LIKIENGATVIVFETGTVQADKAVVGYRLKTVHRRPFALLIIFGQPSEKMKVVGVTGTNGKTTIATLLYKLFTGLGCTCGLLSTVDNHIRDTIIPATHTTQMLSI
jgi:UDP-N-acetylmuramoyl-L-alanyl-D-glutamate--2,6-diaminopimelate ligase